MLAIVFEAHFKDAESYEIWDKHYTVLHVNKIVTRGYSCIKACAVLGILSVYYCRWKKLVANVHEMNTAVEFVPHNTTHNAHKMHA